MYWPRQFLRAALDCNSHIRHCSGISRATLILILLPQAFADYFDDQIYVTRKISNLPQLNVMNFILYTFWKIIFSENNIENCKRFPSVLRPKYNNVTLTIDTSLRAS